MTPPKVLLTGISGFLGSHTAIQLLNKGYLVTGTLRSLSRAASIRSMISTHTDKIENLSFAEADVLDADVWDSLTVGMDFVQHIASPFPRELPKHENELIRPAVDGTLNVLRAALNSGVRRVVITSSIAAIFYGKNSDDRSGIRTEKDWTDPTNLKDTSAYFRSKTLAEKAAWDFIDQSKTKMELSVVCPGAILGPVLEKDFGTSANMVIKIMDGSTPAIPRIGYEVVDVRSVAELLILAMEKAEAANERFIGSAGFVDLKMIADLLRPKFPQYRIPKKMLPDFLVRFISLFDKTIRPVLIDLGIRRTADSGKATQVLGWTPISNEQSVIDCAKSLIEVGILKKK